MSYVYLLKHADLPLIKIGRSKTPLSRCKKIGAESFNLAQSCIVRTTNDLSAMRLERVLHMVYDAERTKDARLPFSGATEWFSVSIFDQAIAFIDREGSAFGVSCIEPIFHKAPVQRRRNTERGKWKDKQNAKIENNRQCNERASWLLWQFLTSAALRISGAASWDACVIDEGLFISTKADVSRLFRQHDMSYFFEVFVDQRPCRERLICVEPWNDQLPAVVYFTSPYRGGSVRLLLDELVFENKLFLKVADLSNWIDEERLYIKTLATHIPQVRAVLGDYVTAIEAIEPPPEIGVTGHVELLTCFVA